MKITLLPPGRRSRTAEATHLGVRVHGPGPFALKTLAKKELSKQQGVEMPANNPLPFEVHHGPTQTSAPRSPRSAQKLRGRKDVRVRTSRQGTSHRHGDRRDRPVVDDWRDWEACCSARLRLVRRCRCPVPLWSSTREGCGRRLETAPEGGGCHEGLIGPSALPPTIPCGRQAHPALRTRDANVDARSLCPHRFFPARHGSLLAVPSRAHCAARGSGCRGRKTGELAAEWRADPAGS